MPPCGGVPYSSASRKKPNRALRVLVRDAEQAEHLPLHVGAMDSDAAAGDLRAVERQVVRAGAHALRRRLEQRHVLRPRRRERMVHRVPALLVRRSTRSSGNSVTQTKRKSSARAGSAAFATMQPQLARARRATSAVSPAAKQQQVAVARRRPRRTPARNAASPAALSAEL